MLLGDAMSIEEDSQELKRAAEDVAEPPAKRAKGSVSVQDMIDEVCKTLSSTELRVPWSDSLREFLLSLAPATLESLQGQRSSNQDIMFRLLDEIFVSEEEHLQGSILDAKAKVEVSVEKKAKAEAAEEEAKKWLQEMVEEIKTKIDDLPKEVHHVSEAEMKLKQSMKELAVKQAEVLQAGMSDTFETLKAGTWTDDLDPEPPKLLASFLPILKQNITDSTLLSSSEGALSKKAEDRGTFDLAVVKQLSEDLEKRLASLQEKRKVTEAAVESQNVVPKAESITLEEAEIMLKQGKQMELAKQRATLVEARQNSYALLKAGIDAPDQLKKHIAFLKKACKKIPDSKVLVAAFPAALQKKPAARGDYDQKIMEELEGSLDKAIASFDSQIEEATLAIEANQKQLEVDFKTVKQAVELEAEERERKQKEVVKERDALFEQRKMTFEPLKTGSWTSQEALKPLLPKAKKLLKQLEMDDATIKTLIGVFKKKPDERENFDGVMIQQIEDTVDKRLATFDQQLANMEMAGKSSHLKDAVAAVDTATDELEEFRDTQQVKLQELIYAEKERQRLENLVEQRKTSTQEKIEDEKKAEANSAAQQRSLEQCRQAKESLACLRERVEGAPEAVADAQPSPAKT